MDDENLQESIWALGRRLRQQHEDRVRQRQADAIPKKSGLKAALDCLSRAASAVTERGAAYGPPAPFFRELARRWSLVLGVEVSAAQVVGCMVQLKLLRGGDDSIVDIAGYAACLAEIEAEERA